MLFVTNKLPFAITVAATCRHKETEAADFRFLFSSFGNRSKKTDLTPRCLHD